MRILFILPVILLFNNNDVISQVHLSDRQEYLIPTGMNNHLYFKKETAFVNQNSYKTTIGIDTLDLPFIEDFSYLPIGQTVNNFYPDQNKWQDSFVFVNNSFPVDPLSYGVATFDGLNEIGLPYGGNTVGLADHLTSKPIFLKQYNLSDSLLLSFYYQPQGYGDEPNIEDSLILEFKNMAGIWNKVWAKAGLPLQVFTPVVLPITDTVYFYDGFQFRFKNFANLSGNTDHWHIDYIILDTGRSVSDTIIQDIAFSKSAKGILKNYTYMPWKQLIANPSEEINAEHTFFIRNNSADSSFINYHYIANEVVYDVFIDSSLYSGISVLPQEESVLNESVFVIPMLTNTDSINVQMKYEFNTLDSDLIISNNQMIHDQVFYNYLAYDDGSAEMAYGVGGTGANEKKVAYKFKLNVPDTLEAIQISFTHLLQDASGIVFALSVWKSIDEGNTGIGDSLIYQWNERPEFINIVNGFYQYTLNIEEPIILSGDFYVGWIQTNSNSINVGFDMATNRQNKIFYNVDGTWKNSSFEGALMIRPVLGKFIPYSVGIRSLLNGNIIYPNPASELIYIDVPDGIQDVKYQIYSIRGEKIKEGIITQNFISVSELIPGIYLLKNTVNDINHFNRFIVN